MNANILKIDVAQQILNLTDEKLLEKIYHLLNKEVIVGYEADGTPISKESFIEDMEKVEREIASGTLKTYSTEEVRNRIFKKL